MVERANLVDRNILPERAIERDRNRSGERAKGWDRNIMPERVNAGDRNKPNERSNPNNLINTK